VTKNIAQRGRIYHGKEESAVLWSDEAATSGAETDHCGKGGFLCLIMIKIEAALRCLNFSTNPCRSGVLASPPAEGSPFGSKWKRTLTIATCLPRLRYLVVGGYL